MSHVSNLALVIPNHGAFSEAFSNDIREAGDGTPSPFVPTDLQIELLDSFGREGHSSDWGDVWDAIVCVAHPDGRLIPHQSATACLHNERPVEHMGYYTLSEAIAASLRAARTFAAFPSCDIEEGCKLAPLVVQGGMLDEDECCENDWASLRETYSLDEPGAVDLIERYFSPAARRQ